MTVPIPLLTYEPNSVTSPDTFNTDMDGHLGELNPMITNINAALAAMNAIAAGGAVSLQYVFSTTTTDADPGAGYLRLSSATQNTSTVIRADLLGSDGSTYTGVLALLDDSTSTNKGYAMLRKATDATAWLLFTIASTATPSGYYNITATCVASSAANPFTNGDALLFDFTPTGDKGDTGATGATGASGASVIRSARTSNTILGTGDVGKLIDVTSGTFTQTVTAAATLGSGWMCWYKNSGTGVVTIDPNSSETIDGLASFAIYSGETRLIQCDGSNFNSVVLSPFLATFTSSGTFVKPPGYSAFGALVWSGGNSGAKAPLADTSPFLAGAGGGCWKFDLPASSVGTSETITIGAGGAAVSTNSTAGNVGGNSSIGTLAVVYAPANTNSGGSVLQSQASTTVDFIKGGQTTNTPPTTRYTWGGSAGSSNGSAASASTVYGGACGGSHDGTNLRAPGTSIFGGNGGAASVSGAATDGTAPGGGGGMGKDSVGNSGAGARGEVRIWGVA